MENRRYEQEVDLKDLLFAVLRRWRPIILVAIIFAILLGGYKGYKNIATMNDPEAVKKRADADYEAMQTYELKKAGLEREIENLGKSIEGQQTYVDNSILMQINPYDEYVSNINLYVDTNFQIMPGSVYQNFDATKSIISAYASLAQDGELSNFLSNELNVDAQYVQELIKVNPNYTTNTLGLSVKHETEEECNRAVSLIIEFFKDKKKALEETVAEHSLNVVNEVTYATVDLDLETRQKNAFNNLSSMENSLNEKTSELAKLEEPKATQVSMGSAIKSGIKYFILGGVLGGFMMVFFACVGFLMSDKVNGEKDLRKRFGVRVLGVFEDTGKKKAFSFVDKWLDKLEGKKEAAVSEETVYAIVAANVDNYIGSLKTLLITGTVDENILKSVAEKLEKILGAKGIHLTAAPNINRSPDTIKLAAQCEGVIFVEQIGFSTFTNIEKELDAFTQLNKTILGAVIR